MPSSFHPGPDWYIAFHELDPSTDSQCIYYTQKQMRCSWSSDDNNKASQLHQLICALPRGTLDLDLLIEYILCCCCMSGRAKHRLRIGDRQELLPLAERWLEESQRIATPTVRDSLSVGTVEDGDTSDCSSGPRSSPSNPPSPGLNQSSLDIDNGTVLRGSDPPDPQAEDAIETTIHRNENAPRYNLRQSNSHVSKNSISSLASTYRAPQSEFAPHVTSPGPNDNASRKLLERLEFEDFKTGSLYIFDRATSPGHVKIGYTARSVEGRLAKWSECGYTPNLVYQVNGVPWVRRAETLTHHELIKEWRRERRCNRAQGCASAHQEWFEMGRERAVQVLGGWADFMKTAQPYDAAGCLKPQWVQSVASLDAKREVVTARALVEQYKASLAESQALTEELANLKLTPKVQMQELADIEAKIEDLKSDETPEIPVPPPREESTLATKYSEFKDESTLSIVKSTGASSSIDVSNPNLNVTSQENEAKPSLEQDLAVVSQDSKIDTSGLEVLSDVFLNLQVRAERKLLHPPILPHRLDKRPTNRTQTRRPKCTVEKIPSGG